MKKKQDPKLVEFKTRFEKKFGDEYSVVSTQYVNGHYGEMIFKHNVCGYDRIHKTSGKIFTAEITPTNFCPICNPNGTKSKDVYTMNYALKYKGYNFHVDMTQKEYESVKTEPKKDKILKFKCDICGYVWDESFNKAKKNGCKNCKNMKTRFDSKGRVIPKKRKYTTEDFRNEVIELTGDEYSLLSEYVNTKTKVIMRHNKCGNEYEVQPRKFKDGCRCPVCSRKSQAEKMRNKKKERLSL